VSYSIVKVAIMSPVWREFEVHSRDVAELMLKQMKTKFEKRHFASDVPFVVVVALSIVIAAVFVAATVVIFL
jgi:hypothetical protein